jgi:hypothetical protein
MYYELWLVGYAVGLLMALSMRFGISTSAIQIQMNQWEVPASRAIIYMGIRLHSTQQPIPIRHTAIVNIHSNLSIMVEGNYAN